MNELGVQTNIQPFQKLKKKKNLFWNNHYNTDHKIITLLWVFFFPFTILKNFH